MTARFAVLAACLSLAGCEPGGVKVTRTAAQTYEVEVSACNGAFHDASEKQALLQRFRRAANAQCRSGNAKFDEPRIVVIKGMAGSVFGECVLAALVSTVTCG
ncbi:MAG TPA: hypothetical protein VFV97_15390 [Rhodanobacteraceae bacterium]|nr:hypothetical protein [Rhodanobacteraceae bacterium]